MRCGLLSVLSILVVSAGVSQAATVTPVEGAVSVNVASGFRPGVGAGEVAPGDRVLVAEGGKAQIRFSPTCAAEIKPGLYVVPSEPVCQAGGFVAGTAAAIIAASGDDRPASP